LSAFRQGDNNGLDVIYDNNRNDGNTTVLVVNALIIYGFLRFFGEYFDFDVIAKGVGVALICFVIFSVYIVVATLILKSVCGWKFIDFTFEKGIFPTFEMKPPDDPMDFNTLKLLFSGEVLLSFIPAAISFVLLFLSANLYFIVAIIAMCDFAFFFCFKKDGNLTKFGRNKLLSKDATAADIIARTILIGYNRKSGMRFRDMPKILFIAPNKVTDMYDFRQLVFAYSFALEAGDYKRVIKLTDLVSGRTAKTAAGITELHFITADRLLAMILGDSPEAEIKKLYAENRNWLLETYSDNILNVRCQTTLYAYLKLVLRERAAEEAQKSISERFWEYAEKCGDSCLVNAYAEKLLEIENKSKLLAQ
jgi:hypothetical protein